MRTTPRLIWMLLKSFWVKPTRSQTSAMMLQFHWAGRDSDPLVRKSALVLNELSRMTMKGARNARTNTATAARTA